jgi:hypothetical protein
MIFFYSSSNIQRYSTSPLAFLCPYISLSPSVNYYINFLELSHLHLGGILFPA